MYPTCLTSQPLLNFLSFSNSMSAWAGITAVEIAEGCRVAAYKLELDFGPEIGTRRSIAQATNYPPEALIGRQVLAVVNFKPRQIGKHVSEVLVSACPPGSAARRAGCS
jgi:tRNA-binding protein